MQATTSWCDFRASMERWHEKRRKLGDSGNLSPTLQIAFYLESKTGFREKYPGNKLDSSERSSSCLSRFAVFGAPQSFVLLTRHHSPGQWLVEAFTECGLLCRKQPAWNITVSGEGDRTLELVSSLSRDRHTNESKQKNHHS